MTTDGLCSRHNGVSSSLLCARCGDTICPKCMTVSPVGYRCPDCSKLTKLPTYNIPKKLLLKVLVVAIFVGLAVGGILFVFALSLGASSLPIYLNYYLFMASIALKDCPETGQVMSKPLALSNKIVFQRSHPTPL